MSSKTKTVDSVAGIFSALGEKRAKSFLQKKVHRDINSSMTQKEIELKLKSLDYCFHNDIQNYADYAVEVFNGNLNA